MDTPQPSHFGIGQLYWVVRDAIIGGDAATGQIVLWNPAAERLFGYSPAEALGRPMDMIVPERLRAAHREGLRRYATLGIGRLVDSGTPVEVSGLRKSGEEVAVELTLAPLSSPPGAPAGSRYVLAVVRDVTERRRADAEREREQRARIAAEAALAARDEFLSTAAHELKTPIAGLLGYAELALRRHERDGTLDETVTLQALDTIRERSRRLARLVDQLLDVSRLGGAGEDALPLRRRDADLVALVHAAIAETQATSSRHRLALAAPPSLDVCVDPKRIRQVLVALLENAVRFSPDGGQIDVTVDAPVDGVARVAVRDRGVGIPEAERARVFERFHQAHRLSHSPGMGLGLYLAREIVERHGGTIAAEAPDGPGALLVLTLPTRAAHHPTG